MLSTVDIPQYYNVRMKEKCRELESSDLKKDDKTACVFKMPFQVLDGRFKH